MCLTSARLLRISFFGLSLFIFLDDTKQRCSVVTSIQKRRVNKKKKSFHEGVPRVSGQLKRIAAARKHTRR